MNTTLWAVVLLENIFLIGYLVRVVFSRSEVRFTAGILLLWAIHRLLFVSVASCRSAGLLSLSDMAMERWLIAVTIQFLSTFMGVGACYLWAKYKR